MSESGCLGVRLHHQHGGKYQYLYKKANRHITWEMVDKRITISGLLVLENTRSIFDDILVWLIGSTIPAWLKGLNGARVHERKATGAGGHLDG